MGGIVLMLANKKPTENARSETTKKTLQVIAFVPTAGPRLQVRYMGGTAQTLTSKPHTGRERKPGTR
jgi:hypothetical protein